MGMPNAQGILWLRLIHSLLQEDGCLGWYGIVGHAVVGIRVEVETVTRDGG